MPYIDLAHKHIPDDYNGQEKHKYNKLYEIGVFRLSDSDYLVRVMDQSEYKVWKNLFKPSRSPLTSVNRLMEKPGQIFKRKWFSLDTPYIHSKKKIARDKISKGQFCLDYKADFLVKIRLTPEIKNQIVKKLLPDLPCKFLDQDIRARSCRCKMENGRITIGVSKYVLEKALSNIQIVHLGGKINI